MTALDGGSKRRTEYTLRNSKFNSSPETFKQPQYLNY
jgi:hypothetical protein